MEATKKKKAYLKPEMTKFEMKMEESFMIASKEEVEIEETQLKAALGTHPCFANGTTCGVNPVVGCILQINSLNNGCNKTETDTNGTTYNPYEILMNAGFKENLYYEVKEVKNGYFYCVETTKRK